jgi:hypothetical protein
MRLTGLGQTDGFDDYSSKKSLLRAYEKSVEKPVKLVRVVRTAEKVTHGCKVYCGDGNTTTSSSCLMRAMLASGASGNY